MSAVIENVRSAGTEMFVPLSCCWVCEGQRLTPVHRGHFDFKEYAEQDPELAEYTGHTFSLLRCEACGFAQPDVLPTLPNSFDRMYDQHWAPDWVEQEFESGWKDMIFRDVLRALGSRLPQKGRSLL